MSRNRILMLASVLFLAMTFLFSGCYTQLRTVTRTSATEEYQKQEEPYYEPEYGEEQEAPEQQQESPSVYQEFNFYGWAPSWYGFYTPPVYSMGIYFGYYDPWFYDPFLWDPWFAWGTGYWGWSTFHFWRVSPLWYYGSPYAAYYYDPYWGWGYAAYGTYLLPRLQKRREFGMRRGLAGGVTTSGSTPYMTTVASGSRSVSRIERVAKKPRTDESLATRSRRTRSSTEMTRLRKTRAATESRIRKTSRTRRTYTPQQRVPRETVRTPRATRTHSRAGVTERTPRLRNKAANRSAPRVRTRKRYVPTKTRTYKPSSATRTRIYRPSGSGRSSTPSFRGSSRVSRSSGSARSSSSSSSRTRKKK